MTTQSPNQSIKLGLLPGTTYKFFILWGDEPPEDSGEYVEITTGQLEKDCALFHTYQAPGKYIIEVAASVGGVFPGIASPATYGQPGPGLRVAALSSDQFKYKRVVKWGADIWGSPTVDTRLSDPQTGLESIFTPCSPEAFRSAVNIQLPLEDNYITFRHTKSLESAWYNCTALSAFPYFDTSDIRTAGYGWWNCISLSSFPSLDFSNCYNLEYAWTYCKKLKSFPFINSSQVRNFLYTWAGCHSLTSFPLIDTLSGSTNSSFIATWSECSSLKSFPLIRVESGRYASPYGNCSSTWNECQSLTSFPAIDFIHQDIFHRTWWNCKSMKFFNGFNFQHGAFLPVDYRDYDETWGYCTALTSFPAVDFLSGTSFQTTWAYCTSLSSFPHCATPSALKVNSTWSNCYNLTSFPSTFRFPQALEAISTWTRCHKLTSFPVIHFPKATNTRSTWLGCEGLVNFPSIQMPETRDCETTWYGCISLTDFGALSSPKCEKFWETWKNCGPQLLHPEGNTAGALTGFQFYPDTFKSMNNGTGCFNGVRLKTFTWSSILTSISAYNQNSNIVFDGGRSKRNVFGTAAYYNLLNKGWTITDGGVEYDFEMSVSVPVSSTP